MGFRKSDGDLPAMVSGPPPARNQAGVGGREGPPGLDETTVERQERGDGVTRPVRQTVGRERRLRKTGLGPPRAGCVSPGGSPGEARPSSEVVVIFGPKATVRRRAPMKGTRCDSSRERSARRGRHERTGDRGGVPVRV